MVKIGFPYLERQSLTHFLRMGRKLDVLVAKWQYSYKFWSKGRLALFCCILCTKDNSCVRIADLIRRESPLGGLSGSQSICGKTQLESGIVDTGSLVHKGGGKADHSCKGP